jgi:hypothetical protein
MFSVIGPPMFDEVIQAAGVQEPSRTTRSRSALSPERVISRIAVAVAMYS